MKSWVRLLGKEKVRACGRHNELYTMKGICDWRILEGNRVPIVIAIRSDLKIQWGKLEI